MKATFYTHVADVPQFVCRLARTVLEKEEKLMILLPAEQTEDFSRLLWSYSGNSFLAHEIYSGAEPFAPIVLAAELPAYQPRLPDNLLNLQEESQADKKFPRVLEIVGGTEEALAAARTRFRDYLAAGYTLEHYKIS